MKIAILTHPLKSNYGGILQNYALQKILLGLGHDVNTINIGKKFNTLNWLKSLIKYPIKKIINTKTQAPLNKRQVAYIEQNIDIFIDKHIRTTEPIIDVNRKIIEKNDFDAIIVGSDQVWRPSYVNDIQNMFLRFLGDSKIKRIAFAASFGIDNWTFTKKQERICAIEAKKFSGISVREKSGIQLCEKYLNVSAELILDPTIFLSKEEYTDLINKEQIPKKQKNQLTVYILDITEKKQHIIDKIAETLKLNIVHINNHAVKNQTIHYKERIVPPIENWLAGFLNADYVVTDSFHGTVFSIIFNKPFITLSNNTRGLTRITSILGRLKLEKQLIINGIDTCNIENLFNIDFSYANSTINVEKIKAIQFLKNSLTQQ